MNEQAGNVGDTPADNRALEPNSETTLSRPQQFTELFKQSLCTTSALQYLKV